MKKGDKEIKVWSAILILAILSGFGIGFNERDEEGDMSINANHHEILEKNRKIYKGLFKKSKVTS